MNVQIVLVGSLSEIPKSYRNENIFLFGKTLFVHKENEAYLYLGTKKDRITREDIRYLGGHTRRQINKWNVEEVNMDFQSLLKLAKEMNEKEVVTCFLEGWYLAGYNFNKYKQKNVNKQMSQLKMKGESYDTCNDMAIIRSRAINTARDFCNEPANKLTPEIYVKRLKEMFEDTKVEVEIIDINGLEDAGFHAVHVVGKGSSRSPYVAILRLNNGAGDPIALVGKGVTFDSGGTNVKTGRDIGEMKMDMGGAAAVTGAIQLLSDLDYKGNLLAVIPLVVNVAGEEAYLPSDVITYRNGLTVEVGNTDAEGRLILADAILYSTAAKAKYIIDIATLTGSIGHALGLKKAGIFCDDEDRLWELKEIGARSGDYVWPMPLVEDYQSLLKSDTADLNNMSASIYGGAITAAMFLKNFVSDDCRWIHIDMANTVRPWKEECYYTAGASGFGVRLLAELVQCERISDVN
ncbi:leucyl aminopeptidase family protein [Alkalihalophilus lindianensis]|uniref:Probable cytosol aminopeptidase n=1 Tax=Alkalihalophilus lindianensis TaxID=1630542 RepID=A0ABU3X8Q1_9BACI|nr:leucyl aminopeptidase family protein [Alkalihalophilus lindianensis]MDV2684266.1 leucyl aminopeptidase family protein [Alkalihalophilus lindianensis]